MKIFIEPPSAEIKTKNITLKNDIININFVSSIIPITKGVGNNNWKEYVPAIKFEGIDKIWYFNIGQEIERDIEISNIIKEINA